MRKRITLKHIASNFNVSIATVSKALKDCHDISISTKEKIQQYAKKHQYQPNRVALNLLQKKTKTIGVVIPNIMNSFFTKVFVGIEEIATNRGYNLISCISNESYEKESKTIELLKNGTIDGFILSMAEETQVMDKYKHLQTAIDEGVPLVLFDRVTDNIDCDKVIVNDFDGACEATNFLIQTGCKRIAVISVIDNLSVGKLRVDGYKKALKSHGKNVEEKLIVRIGKNEDFDTCMKLVLADKSIDGLLCLEESSAINSLELLKAMNYKIPDEMSLICFTNGKLSNYTTPKITTISQHGNHMGELAAKALIDRLEGVREQDSYSTKIVKTSLIERETTKKLT
ncbi:MAG: LacI family DNA-binding transcriptional regulator [Flavicella sp.]